MAQTADSFSSPSIAMQQQQQQPVDIPLRTALPAMKIPAPTNENMRRGHFSLDNNFSPVNQNGSFEFDRVLKSGQVHKRTRKTKSWKLVSIVLRPNILSIYKDSDCTKLRHQINLSDLTAVARQRDPKRKAKHVFGLFSPERNFHIEAPNEKDAQEWVSLIRQEARIDQEEEETMTLMSPVVEKSPVEHYFGRGAPLSSSGSEQEVMQPPRKPRVHAATNPETMHSAARVPSHGLQSYSGNERGSYSDFSDTGFFPDSTLSLPAQEALQERERERNAKADAIYSPSKRPDPRRNPSQLSNFQTSSTERVVYHGKLLLLKSKGGVRAWKSVWAVLRPKSLTLYKNEEEYSALLVLSFDGILDAGDIDPQSRTKKFCLQVITEERTYRFAANSEEELAKWVGAFKSLLKRRKEGEVAREKERKEMKLLREEERVLLVATSGNSGVRFDEGKTGVGTSGR